MNTGLKDCCSRPCHAWVTPVPQHEFYTYLPTNPMPFEKVIKAIWEVDTQVDVGGIKDKKDKEIFWEQKLWEKDRR